jgi:hypothetical protein
VHEVGELCLEEAGGCRLLLLLLLLLRRWILLGRGYWRIVINITAVAVVAAAVFTARRGNRGRNRGVTVTAKERYTTEGQQLV